MTPSPQQGPVVCAPSSYQVDKISAQTFADWQKKAADIALSLPELNPYIPDDFSLIKSEKKYDHPELIVDESNLRVVYAPSRYFASEPKADVSLILRNPKAMDSARNQVMFALNDYLAGLALDQLSNQASVGGISFSTNANNGLMVNANGYTQRLPQLKAIMQAVLVYLLYSSSVSFVLQDKYEIFKVQRLLFSYQFTKGSSSDKNYAILNFSILVINFVSSLRLNVSSTQ